MDATALFNQNDFIEAVFEIEKREITSIQFKKFDWRVFLTASTLLFSSFIGFDAIAQTGNEAKNPTKNIPRAILLAIFIVSISDAELLSKIIFPL